MPPNPVKEMIAWVSDFNTASPDQKPEPLAALTFNALSDYTDQLKNFDFTNVDTGVAKSLIDSLGRKASKQLFEAVGGVVDKGIEIASGVAGATGQWYGMAAGVLGEQGLNWVEKRFETAMGWEDVEALIGGQWVGIDEGFETRRRMGGFGDDISGGTMEELEIDDHERELAEVDELGRRIHIGVTRGGTSNGYQEVFDTQTGVTRNVPVQKLRVLPQYESDRLNADPVMSQLPALLAGGVQLAGAKTTQNGAATKVGEVVECEGYLWRITARHSHTVELESSGYRKSVHWDKIGPAGNKSTWHPSSEEEGFVTSGGFSAGEYVWIPGRSDSWELGCVQGTHGTRDVYVYGTLSGVRQLLDVKSVRHVAAGTNYRAGIFGHWATAVIDGDEEAIKKWLPGVDPASQAVCTQLDPDFRESMRVVDETPSTVYGGSNPLTYSTNYVEPISHWDRPGYTEYDPPTESDNTFSTNLIVYAVGAAVAVFVITR